MPLDIAAVRDAFPGLADGFAYMDNAGGSLVLKAVADRVADHLLTTPVQHGASYDASQAASARLREARADIARFVNAARPEEIVFSSSATQAMRTLAAAMASQFSPGDEIVLTVFDHESNIGPWLTLKERGVVFRFWSIDAETLKIDLDALDALMGPRTRLVCVTHVSNILGTIHPIAEIAERVHAAGAKLVVDGVAFAPHRRIDVQALGADYYVFSFYKTFGPHFALIWGRYEHLAELDGLYHHFYGRDVVPGKLEPGNPNYELAWGSAAIPHYFEGLGEGDLDRAFDAVAEHEEALSERLLAWLRPRNDVRIIGETRADRALRVPTIAFKVDGHDSASIVAETDRHGLGIRFGDFHSRRLAEHLGLRGGGGVVRVSMVHYNTVEEVDRLIAALEFALGGATSD
ncbi:MAG: cysteine desulfurase-like protein [Pseudomonadota bacterium]